jgi:hypothetical protein
MSDDEVTESWFNITPSVLERLRAGGEDEEHFVRRTAEFLVQRQASRPSRTSSNSKTSSRRTATT